jgi:hypothetical protein
LVAPGDDHDRDNREDGGEPPKHGRY